MAGRGEPRHVDAQLGRDHLGRPARDAGNRVKPGEGIGVRGGERRDVALTGGDVLVENVDVVEELGQQKAVMGGDPPGQRLP